MEFQALHGLAKKLMGIPAVRKEVLEVLNDDPNFQGIQEELAIQTGQNNTRLRRRLPASRIVRSSSGSSANEEPHADTWTEPSSRGDSPRNGDMNQDTLDLSSDWDGSEFELLPGPDDGNERSVAPRKPQTGAKPGIGEQLIQWLQNCARTIASAVQRACHGALKLMKGLLRNCAKLMKDVGNWCQRSIEYIKQRLDTMPNWAKVTAMVVGTAVLMGAVVMILGGPFLL